MPGYFGFHYKLHHETQANTTMVPGLLAKIISTRALGTHLATAALTRVEKELTLCRHVQVPGQLGVTRSVPVPGAESTLRKWR